MKKVHHLHFYDAVRHVGQHKSTVRDAVHKKDNKHLKYLWIGWVIGAIAGIGVAEIVGRFL